jgi:hypothetical protein
MKSIEERLTLIDPSPSGAYAPAAYSAMISRVVAMPLVKPAAGLHIFKLRMAGSVAVASLLTVLGITVIDTVGSSLPVLGFAAPSIHQAVGKYATSFAPAASTVMIPTSKFQFNGAGGFSRRGANATVYTMQAPSDGVATLAHAASVLKVDIGAVVSRNHGLIFTSSARQYSGMLLENSGFVWWQISGNSSPTSSSSSSPSVSSLEVRSRSLARQMGSLDLGAASVVPVPGPPGGPTTVNVPIVVGGEPTTLGYEFTFASDGKLMSATGEDFTLQSAASYPVVSPAAGVGEITSQIGLPADFVGFVAGVGGPLVSGSSSGGVTLPPTNGPVAAATVPSSSAGSTPLTPGTPEVSTVVDLTGVSTKYGFFSMSGSTTMLLPTYAYTGYRTGDSSPTQVTFQVVAVDPSYLNLANVQSGGN